MKLSNIKGERTLRVMADLLEHIGEIAMDEKALEFFVPQANNSKINSKTELFNGQSVLSRILKNLPYLIRNHEKALYSICAILDGVEYSKYVENVNMIKIANDIKSLVFDEELKQLFTSAKTV